MKFKKPVRDRENAKNLIAFMKEIYTIPCKDGSARPVGIEMITDDGFSTGIVVYSDKVISKLTEDKGIAPSVPWEMYTFMDLMKNAGYRMHKMAPGSDIAVFYLTSDAALCSACMTDCKYTGVIINIPVPLMDEVVSVPVRMCLTCATQFRSEFESLVCIEDEPEKEPKKEPKKGLFRRILDKFRK